MPSPRNGRPRLEKAADDRTTYERGCVVGGRYVLVRLIGQGGMGSVWVAWDHTLQVEVAFKVLRGGAANEKAEERLLREARAAALLRHPAVVRVFDFGVHEGRDPFIVMELLEGESLGAYLVREGPLGAVRTLRLLLPIVDGLDVAHREGVVHRDLKPDNMVLSHDERGRVFPKVVDFGVAKLNRGPTAKITKGGSLLGTPEYMAPEQARGEEGADERTDVWALSVSLYELIAGQMPFSGANYNAVLRAILETEPKPLGREAGVDEALWQIVARGLRKDPSERWPSMRALGEALARWLLAQGVSEDACGASLHAMWLDDAETPPIVTPPFSRRLFSPVAPTLHEDAAPAPTPAPRAERASAPVSGVGGMRDLEISAPMLPTSVALPDEAIVKPRRSPRRVAFAVVAPFATATALLTWQATLRFAPSPPATTTASASPAPAPAADPSPPPTKGASTPSSEQAIAPSAERVIAPSAGRAIAPSAERTSAPSAEGSSAPSAEGPSASAAKVASAPAPNASVEPRRPPAEKTRPAAPTKPAKRRSWF